ncbi:SPOR domain-containing protein [Falsiroseomonas sp. CW058]|uniref:SPOR domain-containing protein n=1 Tax=Falsiroseomonas sp. CW058 TaxID=3388664 RepID=UPI003D31E0DA
MSDAVVPSYRVHREASRMPWRMLAAAGGIVAVAAAGAAGWWAVGKIGARSVPVIEADPRPFKVRPADAGGLRVPNQNELVLERAGQRPQTPAQAGRPATLAPPAETPNIDGLRAAVAPPPAPRPAPPPQAAAPAPAAAPPAQVAAPQPAAPAAQPAAAPAARPVPTTGRVQVQLGALGSEEAARAEWDRLSRRAPELFQGRQPVVMRLEREGQAPLFRLRTSGLPDQDAAAQFCEQVRARGGACVPVR